MRARSSLRRPEQHPQAESVDLDDDHTQQRRQQDHGEYDQTFQDQHLLPVSSVHRQPVPASSASRLRLLHCLVTCRRKVPDDGRRQQAGCGSPRRRRRTGSGLPYAGSPPLDGAAGRVGALARRRHPRFDDVACRSRVTDARGRRLLRRAALRRVGLGEPHLRRAHVRAGQWRHAADRRQRSARESENQDADEGPVRPGVAAAPGQHHPTRHTRRVSAWWRSARTRRGRPSPRRW